MRASRFDNDLKNLAIDIAASLNMKKQYPDFLMGLLDCIVGLKSFNKKIENLATTGQLIQQCIKQSEKDLWTVFQKKNEQCHKKIINDIINVFSQYGTQSYKEVLNEQVSSLPLNMWKTNKFSLPKEPLLSLFLHAYIDFVNNNQNVTKNDFKLYTTKLITAASILTALEDDLEII